MDRSRKSALASLRSRMSTVSARPRHCNRLSSPAFADRAEVPCPTLITRGVRAHGGHRSKRFRGRPHLHRAARRTAVGRGPDGPVDARRQPDQVAPRAHHLVLRDLRAAPACPRLPHLRSRPTSISSTPITKPSARAIRGPSAACSPVRAWTRSWPIAGTCRTRWSRCSTAANRDVDAIVELGLHHEQQHQELILMDAKHLLSLNPLKPAYRAVGAVAWRGDAIGVARLRRRAGRDRP